MVSAIIVLESCAALLERFPVPLRLSGLLIMAMMIRMKSFVPILTC